MKSDDLWGAWKNRGETHPAPIIANAWWRPLDVKLIGDCVGYNELGPKDFKELNAASPFFISFLDLYSQSDKEIVRWARQWGILGLCGCGRPHYHEVDRFGRGCLRLSVEQGYALEPCSRYRDYSIQLRAVLRLMHDIRNGQPGGDSDREVLARAMKLSNLIVGADDREFVAHYLDLMLRHCGVRLSVLWFEGDRPETSLWNSPGLLGRLVGQLTLHLSGTDDIRLCDKGCGTPIVFQQFKAHGGSCRACERRRQYRASKRKKRGKSPFKASLGYA